MYNECRLRTWLGLQVCVQCWGRRLRTTAAHVTSVAMAHGRVAEECDSEYRAARAHEGALCCLGHEGAGVWCVGGVGWVVSGVWGSVGVVWSAGCEV